MGGFVNMLKLPNTKLLGLIFMKCLTVLDKDYMDQKYLPKIQIKNLFRSNFIVSTAVRNFSEINMKCFRISSIIPFCVTWHGFDKDLPCDPILSSIWKFLISCRLGLFPQTPVRVAERINLDWEAPLMTWGVLTSLYPFEISRLWEVW